MRTALAEPDPRQEREAKCRHAFRLISEHQERRRAILAETEFAGVADQRAPVTMNDLRRMPEHHLNLLIARYSPGRSQHVW